MKEKNKLKISRLLIVEGKYDKMKLQTFIDGTIVETNGFRLYKDKEKCKMLLSLAKKKGAVIVTDSDSAGFQLRGYLHSLLRDCEIVDVYIPQIHGKEKRKEFPGKEELLGVEGIEEQKLRQCFLRCGAAEAAPFEEKQRITKMDFYEDGLIGATQSSVIRQKLLRSLELPSYLTTNSLLSIINSFLSYEEYKSIVSQIKENTIS